MKIQKFNESLEPNIYYSGKFTVNFKIDRKKYLDLIEITTDKDYIKRLEENGDNVKDYLLKEYIKSHINLFEHEIEYVVIDENGKILDEEVLDTTNKYNI